MVFSLDLEPDLCTPRCDFLGAKTKCYQPQHVNSCGRDITEDLDANFIHAGIQGCVVHEALRSSNKLESSTVLRMPDAITDEMYSKGAVE